jgi:hypothetical protein
VSPPRTTPTLGLRAAPVRLTTDEDLVRPRPGFPGTVLNFAGYGSHSPETWESSQLIWEYSPLNDQYGQSSGLLRTGLD